MPDVLSSALTLPWKDGASVLSSALTLPWKDGASVLGTGSPYTPATPPTGGTPITPQPLEPQTRIAAQAVYATHPTVVVKDLRDDTVLEFDSFTMREEDGGVLGTFNGTGDAALYAQLIGGEQPAQIEVALNGVPWRFVVTSVSRARGPASTAVSVTGQSLAAVAGMPYSAEQNWVIDGATTAAQIAATANLQTGLDVDWRVEDWLIPDRVFTFSGSPLGVVRRIAETIGAIVLSHRSAYSVKVLPRYPVLPNEWATTAPDVEIALDTVGSDSFERTDAPEYNGVYLSGQQSGAVGYVSLEGTNGAQLHPLITDLLLTDEPAIRQRGIAVLGASGEQTRVTLDALPVLNGTGEPGVLEVGQLVRVVDPDETWYGLVRSVSVSVSLPSVDQTVELERHTKPLPGTVAETIPGGGLTFSGTIPAQTVIVGATFSLDLSTYFSGGDAPYAYSMRYGTLPAALTLNASTGVVSGAFPSALSATTLAFRATDEQDGQADTNFFSLQAVVGLTFSGTIPAQSLTVGAAFSLSTASYWSGGVAPYVWSLASGTLPAGITLNTSTGVVSGTPTAAGTSSGVSFTVTDALGTARTSNTLTFTATASGPDANTVLQLNFNGTDGSQSIDDESANNFDVTTGSSTRVLYTGDAKFGTSCLRATTCDGGDGLAWFNSAFLRLEDQPITIEGWIKRATTGSVASTDCPTIFYWGALSGAYYVHLYDTGEGTSGGGYLYLQTSDASSGPFYIGTGSWVFVQLRVQANGAAELRLGGTLVATFYVGSDIGDGVFAISQTGTPDSTAVDYRFDSWRYSTALRSTSIPTAAF